MYGGLSMGFFNKNQDAEQSKAPRSPGNLAMFRILAIGYVSYLCFNMVKLYLTGSPDAPSLSTLIIGLVVLGGGVIFLAIISYQEWKRNKAAYDEYMAELRAEAEAKRAAEEAEAAALAEEDAYYDALEAAESEEE